MRLATEKNLPRLFLLTASKLLERRYAQRKVEGIYEMRRDIEDEIALLAILQAG